MYKNYILTYDPVEVGDKLPQLAAFIQSNATTFQFGAPFLGTVFIKSADPINIVYGTYNAFFNGVQFFLGEIDNLQSSGRLSQDIWNWLNQASPSPLPYTPLGPK